LLERISHVLERFAHVLESAKRAEQRFEVTDYPNLVVSITAYCPIDAWLACTLSEIKRVSTRFA
jgi:hypothetical protein